jgi:hypothetical protein
MTDRLTDEVEGWESEASPSRELAV